MCEKLPAYWRDLLESKLATARKRKAVKDLLGVAVEQGEDLRVTLRKEGDSFPRRG